MENVSLYSSVKGKYYLKYPNIYKKQVKIH